jgi:exodeoxyribonuclease VIII
MDLMIDLEGLGTGPDTTILTIAAQAFDPSGSGYYTEHHYYARVTLESQETRSIQQGTIDWWATQPSAARDEAFGTENRIPLEQALDELGQLVWKAKRVWAQGPTYDMNILEHAYKSYGKSIPWQFYAVRDSRTVFSLWPGLPKPPTSHHALEDCRRQIDLLQHTLRHLNVKELA